MLGMERAFFEENRQALRATFEARVQKLLDEWESSSDRVRALERRRKVAIGLITFYGLVTLMVREGRDAEGKWVRPSAEHFGLRPKQTYSPEMEKRLAMFAVEAGSYEKAAGLAEGTWLPTSDDAVRTLTLRLAAVAPERPPSEVCQVAARSEDTLIVMADGWNARHRGENWGRDKEDRELPDRVHWHEIRSAVLFKLSALLAVSGKRKALMDKHIVAVPAETSPYDFGLHLQQEMARMGSTRAKAVFFVMDGGVWLWNLFTDRFEKCSMAMLDFYHLSQHLHALAEALHSGAPEKARAWCAGILHDLKHKSPVRLFRTLDELLREPPSCSAELLEVIQDQNAYFRKHEKHMDYAANAALGVPIGSGSVESLCSQLQDRLKRTGQFWTKEGFASILLLIVRYRNRELDSLWQVVA